MAIDFGTSNTTRYYSVPDHTDFTLPNSDWTWLALVRPQTPGTVSNYVISTGDWGVGNSFNLYTYGTTSGAAVKVDGLTEVQVSGNALALNTWYWIFAVRSSGVLNCGQIALNASATTEAVGITISAAYDATTGPQIGRRAAGLVRNWNGQISQAAFISGAGISDAQLVELASGAPLLSMPFAPSIKFLFHGKTADATIADLIAGKIATKQGTSYGTGEEDAQTPYIWVPEYTRGVAAASPDKTAALTGQSLTSSQGSLSPSTSVALSGRALSASQGTLTPSVTGSPVTVALTGQSLEAFQGILAADSGSEAGGHFGGSYYPESRKKRDYADRDREDIRRLLTQIDEVQEEVAPQEPQEVKEQVAATIKQYLTVRQSPDLTALQQDVMKVRQLLELWEQPVRENQLRKMQDEDEELLLMLF